MATNIAESFIKSGNYYSLVMNSGSMCSGTIAIYLEFEKGQSGVRILSKDFEEAEYMVGDTDDNRSRNADSNIFGKKYVLEGDTFVKVECRYKPKKAYFKIIES